MTKSPIKVLYIAGWQRSGSTILGNLLGQIDGFFSTGELYYLWDYVWARNVLCGCGRAFHDCPVWKGVLEHGFGGSGSVDVEEMRRTAVHACKTRHFPRLALPGTRRRVAAQAGEYLANLQRLYAAIAATTGSRVIVDSSKWPSYARLLAFLPNVELKVVHLVRDPRAVAHSWQRKKALPDRFPPEHMYRSLVDSTLHWNAWNFATDVYFGSRQLLRLRYEDFARHPVDSVRQILEFIGEEPNELPFVSERRIELRTTHTVSGNPIRLSSGAVEIVEDDEWRERMDWRDNALVTLLTFPLLCQYGYLRRPVHRPRREPDVELAPLRRS